MIAHLSRNYPSGYEDLLSDAKHLALSLVSVNDPARTREERGRAAIEDTVI